MSGFGFLKPAKTEPRFTVNVAYFFSNFQNKPERLTKDLEGAITVLLEEFATDFPVNHTPLLTHCLTQIKDNKSNIIARCQHYPESEAWQKQYKDFCGMLASVLVQLNNAEAAGAVLSPPEKILQEALTEILSFTYLEKIFHKSRSEALADVIFSYESTYVLMSRQASWERLQSSFSLAYEQLVSKLERMKVWLPYHPELIPVMQQAKSILDAFNEGIKKPAFDLSFALNVLETTNRLLEKPDDLKLQMKYKKLANVASGNPGFWRKVSGYMLALVGALLVAASAVMIPVLATISIGGIVSGVLLTTLGLFGVRRRGLSKHLFAFSKAQKNAQATLDPIATSFGYAPAYVNNVLMPAAQIVRRLPGAPGGAAFA